MGYTIKTIEGELKEYAFDFGGVVALRNFTARTNGNRLIVQSAENANFTILDALVNEVEIDGVVYDNITSAQEALQRLVFNPRLPVIMTQEERKTIEAFKNWTGRGLQDDTIITLTAGTAKKYTLPSNSLLFALQLQGAATLQVGSTQNSVDDLGELTGAAGSVLQLGLLKVSEIWLQSDDAVEVVPIIYKQ